MSVLENIIYDKNNQLNSICLANKILKNIKFDILLHMQYSFRSNLLSMLV